MLLFLDWAKDNIAGCDYETERQRVLMNPTDRWFEAHLGVVDDCVEEQAMVDKALEWIKDKPEFRHSIFHPTIA